MNQFTWIFAGATVGGQTKRILRSNDHHPIPDFVTGMGAPWWGILLTSAVVLASGPRTIAAGTVLVAMAALLLIVRGFGGHGMNRPSITVELTEIKI